MFTVTYLRFLFDYQDGQLIWRDYSNSNAPAGSVAGCRKASGYIYVGIKGNTYLLHRLIYAWHTGEWPELVDHKDRDNTNNHIENLRPLSQTENRINSAATWSKTGFKGVKFDASRNRYITRLGKRYVGCFKSAEEAGQAYIKAREALYPNAYI